jgi:HK97 family phage portal protein
MGIFPNIKEIRSSLANPEKWLSDWFAGGIETNAGVRVDEGTAMNFATVFNAVTIISGIVMSLPFQLFHRVSNDERERAFNHPAEKFGSLKVNSRGMTASRFRQTAQCHLCLHGNFYAQKIYNRAWELIELYVMRPDKMKVESKQGIVTYTYTKTDGTQYPMRDWEVLHVPGLGYDGIMGYPVISLARESIGLGMAMEEYQARFYGSGTHPGVVVKHPGIMKDKTREQLKKDLTEKYSGLGKTHKLLVLEDDMDIAPLDMKLVDAEFLASKKFSVSEIARWFNLPEHMLKNMERAIQSNVEQMWMEFIPVSMAPWFTVWKDEFGSQVLEDDWGEYYYEFITDALLRGDTLSRYEAYSKAIMNTMMKPNEARRRENLPTDPSGDTLFVPTNMVPIGMAGNIPAKQTTRDSRELIMPVLEDVAGRICRILSEEMKSRSKEKGSGETIIESIFSDRDDYFKKTLKPAIGTYRNIIDKQGDAENDAIRILQSIRNSEMKVKDIIQIIIAEVEGDRTQNG